MILSNELSYPVTVTVPKWNGLFLFIKHMPLFQTIYFVNVNIYLQEKNGRKCKFYHCFNLNLFFAKTFNILNQMTSVCNGPGVYIPCFIVQ